MNTINRIGANAASCAVCFAPAGTPQSKALTVSILLLVAVTFSIIGCMAVFAWRMNRRGHAPGRPE